ncbi:MAG: hypothetical protein WCO04_01470 [Pseudomonadota bacterium]|jgi:ABC-type phosphate transport system ATPase subunit
MSNQPVYWKQRNGELISIDNMDVNHLRNVLKMIVKNSNKHKIEWFNNLHYGNKIAYVSDILGKSDYVALNHEIVKIYDTVHKKKQKEFKLNGDMANEFNDLPESMDIGNNELGHY